MVHCKKILDILWCTAYICLRAVGLPRREQKLMETEMMKSFENFPMFGKEGFEAYVASATAMTKAFQAMAAEAADFQRKSFEQGVAVLDKVVAAKSVDKAFEIQQGYAKDAYEAYVGEVNKMGEIYMSAAKDAFKPFEGQMAQFGVKAPK